MAGLFTARSMASVHTYLKTTSGTGKKRFTEYKLTHTLYEKHYPNMDHRTIKTLGDLKKSGYVSKGIKEEMRNNLVKALREKKNIFTGIRGYDDTVIPQLQTAILSRHNMILLGLRGQAKTRIARTLTQLLDEYVPVVAGSELNDDPLQPLSRYGIDLVAEKGDQTPVAWLHRNDRYAEKLATPDVSVSDLIGDIDPIKAATMKLTYADEKVIHFGMVPRSNRCIFVINELPDLQARIQVSLFNILQEGDIQIRGFKLRLPLDIQFIFTANPEDYTNRGSIVTPLKDRIGSQILTHYPRSMETSAEITLQEARMPEEQKSGILNAPLLHNLIEQVAFEARKSEFVDQKSGVSARLTISALENLFSVAERRMLMNGEERTNGRVSDLYGIVPAITGKVELVYEGELEGITSVAYTLIGKGIRKEFVSLFPDPERIKKSKQKNPYADLVNWFAEGNEVDLLNQLSDRDYEKQLKTIPFLMEIVRTYHPKAGKQEQLLLMEFVLHGLAEFSQISRKQLEKGVKFKDLIGSMLNLKPGVEEEE
jgi:magnesium chelatase subunit I